MNSAVQNDIPILPKLRLSLDNGVSDSRVDEYLRRHQLQREFNDAVSLAKRIFPTGNISWRIESDPECAGSWIELDIAEKTAVESALARYDEFMTEWTAFTTGRVDQLLRVTINLS